jgi:lipoprotein-anchoring transpeptidase ErfK/SrfK
MRVHTFALVLSFLGFSLPVYATQTIEVDFTSGELQIIDNHGQAVFSTPVVLPRRDFYRLPVTGVVIVAEMGPTWTPTANTRAQNPGKYKPSYGPYEPGNAMGHCKITIDFDQDDSILSAVRIHGNAKTEHLNGRYSRGCIRMPDSVCLLVVDLINNYPGETNILFTSK